MGLFGLSKNAVDYNAFLNDTRRDYHQSSFSEATAMASPMDQFEDWFALAKASNLPDPNAMHLTTVSVDGWPKNRVVLLKCVDANGFVFFTNYRSQKARDMAHNPQVGLTFFWPTLEKQIRIEGLAQPVEASMSDAYFATRPRDAQLTAWASQQSEPIAGRDPLDAAFVRVSRQFPDTVPRPDDWGGYCVRPQYMEFWQGRPNRFHDRICYAHTPNGWVISRICP